MVSAKPRPRRRRGRVEAALLALLKIIILVNIFWVSATSLVTFAYRYVQPPATVLMAYRAWVDGWRIDRPRPVRLRAVPTWLRSMLISVEDYKFYSHFGLDFEAFQRAWEINSRLSEPLYGGSTLTMQVARTLFLVPAKSYLRKYLEVVVALELELILGKNRILELYFSYAEWGKGVFGIDAASRRYYDKTVRNLSRDEGARLVALLSSPIKYHPDNFGRSLILRERYAFLAKRYVDEGGKGSAEAAAPPASSAPATTEAASSEGASPSPLAPEPLPAGPSLASPDSASGGGAGAPTAAETRP
jgi:monofunctional biosynthetic peptidoglycan transglycosylase